MIYEIVFTGRFKKDYKLALSRGRDISKLDAVISALANGQTLEERYRDHALSGKWKRHRECHIEPDWLLIYLREDDTLVLTLSRTGTPSDLFKK